MSLNLELSLVPNEGGLTQQLAIGVDVAQTTVLYTDKAGYVNIYSTAECFMRMGTNPLTVRATDQYIPAGNLLRVGPIPPNYKLCFDSATAGTVYVTKET